MKNCPNCGTQTEDSAFFCPNCQADLPASTVIAPQPADPGPYDPTAGVPDAGEGPGVPPYPPAAPAPPAPGSGYSQAPPPAAYAPAPQYPQPHEAQGHYPPGGYPPGAYPPPGYPPMAPALDTDGMPIGAKKFAWGALLFGWIWCAVYGLWAFLGIDIALSVVSGILNAFEEDNMMASVLSGVLGLMSLGWRIYLGFAGPKAFWQANPTKYTVERWNRHQRNWGIAALVYLGVICLCIGAIFALVVAGVGSYLGATQ